MKNLHLLLFMLFACIPAVDLLSQDVRHVDIPPFKKVSVSSGIDLFLSPASKVGLTIKGEKNLISKVHCEVVGDHLTISMQGTFSWFSNKAIEVYLDYTELDFLLASAGSDVRSESVLTAPMLEVKGSSGSDIYLMLDVQMLKVSLSSGSDGKFKGRADELKANISSGSDLEAFDLKVRKATIDASGGADAEVFVTAELKANASGGSDIQYKGSPVIKDVNSSGGGDVTGY